jgi:hypothetical protein
MVCDAATMQVSGQGVDRLTQRWVRGTGRRVDLTTDRWLDGPIGRATRIDSTWLADEATRLNGTLSTDADQGLLPRLADLDRDGFSTSALHPSVTNFYEHTRSWNLDVWSQWSAPFVPGAWLLMTVFARRLRQFSLPLRPLDVSHGMTSEVTQLVDPEGQVLGAAWQRSLRRTGESVYGGWYGTVALPGRDWTSVRVVFPLPNGSLQVFLRPDHGPDGSLVLTSGLGSFGEEGTYLVVNDTKDEAFARRIPIAETFNVFVDADGTLRTDHELKLWSASVLRLHYRLTRMSSAGVTTSG